MKSGFCTMWVALLGAATVTRKTYWGEREVEVRGAKIKRSLGKKDRNSVNIGSIKLKYSL